jgi:hypothetical protein
MTKRTVPMSKRHVFAGPCRWFACATAWVMTFGAWTLFPFSKSSASSLSCDGTEGPVFGLELRFSF